MTNDVEHLFMCFISRELMVVWSRVVVAQMMRRV